MEDFFLSAVVEEMRPEVEGRAVGKVEAVGNDLVLDLKPGGDRVLTASLDRKSPALYLASKGAYRDRPGHAPSNALALQMKKHLAGGKVRQITKPQSGRVVRLDFEGYDLAGERKYLNLLIALTGRTANAFLMDSQGVLIGSFYDADKVPHTPDEFDEPGEDPDALIGSVQDSASLEDVLRIHFGPGSIFAPMWREEFIARALHASPAEAFRSLIRDLFRDRPSPLVYSSMPLQMFGRRLCDIKRDLKLSPVELSQAEGMLRNEFATFSEAAEQYYRARRLAEGLRDEFNSVRQRLTRRVARLDSTMRAVELDHERFDNPENLKKMGDLILANIATGKTEGSKLRAVDYYDPEQREIEIELGEARTLQQAATGYFTRYQKSRRALSAIASRQDQIARELDPLRELLGRLEGEPTADVIERTKEKVAKILGTKPPAQSSKGGRAAGGKDKPIGRRFRSTDGYEIVVGRNDRENDSITFRLARSNDVWMHAADYPGSHVLVRNPTRDEVPHRTINEAAQIAAFYSQAKREGKAAVHYTQKKFVSKPPKSKPGLARLSSFKTILVEPRCELEKIEG